MPGALRDRAGRVLITANTLLDEAKIASLGRRIIAGLYAGDDWPDDAPAKSRSDGTEHDSNLTSLPNDSGKSADPQIPGDSDSGVISVDMLRLGMRLSHDIFDRSGLLLLAAGSRVTSRFLLLLQHRDIKVVCTQSSGKQADSGAEEILVQRLEARLETKLENPPKFNFESAPKNRSQLPLDELWKLGREGLKRFAETSTCLADVSAAVIGGQTVASDTMRGLVNDFVDMLTLDHDLLSTIVSIQETRGDYLYDHGVNVALTSMTMASYMGVRREQVLSIGLGAVLQDIGMQRVPSEIRLSHRALTADELGEIKRHPIYTLEYLEQIRGLPIEVSFIGYQVHERLDGSGYPRQRKGTTIHPFAKLVAIADAYCAMTQPRPHRPAVLPHNAVKHLLTDGSRGKLDRAFLRVFLDCVSAFPIGSRVELSTGDLVHVVRANPGAHTHPVVAERNADGKLLKQVIDLSIKSDVHVVRAVD